MSVSHLLAQNRVVISVKAPIGETYLLLLGEQCLCSTDVGSCFVTTNMLFSYRRKKKMIVMMMMDDDDDSDDDDSDG